MKQGTTVGDRLKQQLAEFSRTAGASDILVSPKTDMIKDLGFTSLQGIEFVLDLCDEFEFDFPADFNPFVADDGRRGRSFGELIQAVETHLGTQGDSHGG